MNERIQQLFWKAGGKTSVRNLMSNPVQIVETNELWDDEIEKFALLIAKECLEKIYSVTIDNPTDDWDQGYASGLIQAAETIKEHFGVLE